MLKQSFRLITFHHFQNQLKTRFTTIGLIRHVQAVIYRNKAVKMATAQMNLFVYVNCLKSDNEQRELG